jgi:hypothetical protein
VEIFTLHIPCGASLFGLSQNLNESSPFLLCRQPPGEIVIRNTLWVKTPAVFDHIGYLFPVFPAQKRAGSLFLKVSRL